MPNYARRSSLDLDEMFGNYIKNESNTAMMRNIRTKERMNSAHHCEDKECSGSPSFRCAGALHFSWCLAPVVDEDKRSDTYGKVVICGQRFQCISPKGCAVHTYLAGFNLDIKNARNNHPKIKFEWKAIFEASKSEHDAALASNAKEQELLSKWKGMTEHQQQRLRKLKDQAAYQRSLDKELAFDGNETGEEKDTEKAEKQMGSGNLASAMIEMNDTMSETKPRVRKNVRRGKKGAKLRLVGREKTVVDTLI